MVRHRALAAALTVLLHAVVVAALLRAATGVVKPPEPPAAQAPSVDDLRDAGEQIVVAVDLRPAIPTSGLACPGSTYVGLGATADPRTDRIILVGDNTPASRAGLQQADIVLNPDVWRGTHREGDLLRVLVLRDGTKLVALVRVGRICIE